MVNAAAANPPARTRRREIDRFMQCPFDMTCALYLSPRPTAVATQARTVALESIFVSPDLVLTRPITWQLASMYKRPPLLIASPPITPEWMTFAPSSTYRLPLTFP